MAAHTPQVSPHAPVTHASVLVLGAGMAGIACARALADAGVEDVLVLEGQERIGGRVACLSFAGHVVELGANWIHGNPPQPLWALAQKVHDAPSSRAVF